jgi:hypothetical protein
MKKTLLVLLAGAVVGLLAGGYYLYRRLGQPVGGRFLAVSQWLQDPSAHADWKIAAGERCASSPFVFPTTGMIGFIWGDSFRIAHSHTGLDIFGGTSPGQTAVVAAYPGYLTRLESWKSTVIIRIPSDPLQPARQIWTYYTHMADPQGNSLVDSAFPPGTKEVLVAAGTVLGLQGNYSGEPDQPVGVHLHFSIIKDDGKGSFTDERQPANTLDPSPYFNLPLNAAINPGEVPTCPR